MNNPYQVVAVLNREISFIVLANAFSILVCPFHQARYV